MMKTCLKGLAAVGMLLLGQSALADSLCPDGQFMPQIQGCLCPNGASIAANQWCNPNNRGGEGGRTIILPPAKTWGAIAIDRSRERKSTGFSWSKKSQAEANKEALETCKLSTCKIVLTFQNSCGAVVSNPEGIWGGGVDVNKDRALQKAVDACYAKGAKGCYEWVKPKCAGAPRD